MSSYCGKAPISSTPITPSRLLSSWFLPRFMELLRDKISRHTPLLNNAMQTTRVIAKMATQLVPLSEVERLSPRVIRILAGNPGKVRAGGVHGRVPGYAMPLLTTYIVYITR